MKPNTEPVVKDASDCFCVHYLLTYWQNPENVRKIKYILIMIYTISCSRLKIAKNSELLSSAGKTDKRLIKMRMMKAGCNEAWRLLTQRGGW